MKTAARLVLACVVLLAAPSWLVAAPAAGPAQAGPTPAPTKDKDWPGKGNVWVPGGWNARRDLFWEEEFPDMLHPNGAGYAKWVEALKPLMAKLKIE
jgi:lysophospholipase L1-like esterase